MISEIKINESFPKSQFLIKDFSDPFRIDRNIHGEGILLYVRVDIPTKLLSIEPIRSECFFVELNLRKRKWLISCSYNPHKNKFSKHIEILSKNLDLSSQYKSNIIIGDFNVGVSDPHMNDFCNGYNLSSLINEPIFYKNPDNLSCIDLILTNSPRSLQGSCVVETGLSDFHRIVVTMMKTIFQRLPPEIRTYRNYNKFYNHKFRETLGVIH